MSWLGEQILKLLVLGRERIVPTATAAPGGDSYESYYHWQFSSSEKLFRHYPNFDIRGRRVLEIGCGTGGRTAYLASVGPAAVVGIDINADEIRIAKNLSRKFHPQLAGVLEYHVSQENEVLDIGQFDYVLLVDSMEHVVSPPAILRLAYQYTKPGGKCYFNTIGWYHHKGSHMPLIPWANVLFSDETILNVMRWKISRPDYVPTRFDSDPPLERWRDIYNLRDRPGEHLNKITISEIKKLCRYTIFEQAQWKVIGFQSRKHILGALNLFNNVPVLQEIFHSGIVVELRSGSHKPQDA
jgi:2-polyprenyl-3-methyl-5-hydroxy-6-metoxy-1,4-benzoquinol methylase